MRERDIFIISCFLQSLGNWSSEDSVYKIVNPECMQHPLPSTYAVLHVILCPGKNFHHVQLSPNLLHVVLKVV